MLKTTLTTKELGLRLTVAAIGEPAAVAPLRCMPRINSDNLASFGFGLVFEEALELREAPGVKSAFGFSARGFAPSSNVRKVFNYNRSSWLNILENRGGDNVIAIASETLFTSRKASQVAFSRLGTVRLKITFEAEGSFDNLLPMAFAVESVVGSNGRSGNAEINTYCFTVVDKINIGQFDDDMQVEPTFAFDEVGGRRRTVNSIFGIFRNGKRNFEPSVCRRHADKSFIPVDFEGVSLIPWRTRFGLWAGCFLFFLRTSYSCLYGLRCLVNCLNMQIGNKIGKSIFTTAINNVMKFVGVALALFPSYAAYCVEGLRELADRFNQGVGLFASRYKSQPNRSIHGDIIPYKYENMQI